MADHSRSRKFSNGFAFYVRKNVACYTMGVGAERPRNWGGTTAFGADRPGADRLWGGSPVPKLVTPVYASTISRKQL